MIEIINATVKSVNIQNAKNGGEGISIVCDHADGSEWGKKIYSWCWWTGDTLDNNLMKWAKLITENPTEEQMRAIILSHKLCGMIIEMQVDQSAKFWKVLDFGKVGTIKPESTTTATVPDDDIPF